MRKKETKGNGCLSRLDGSVHGGDQHGAASLVNVGSSGD
jgi:hypothetical protein